MRRGAGRPRPGAHPHVHPSDGVHDDPIPCLQNILSKFLVRAIRTRVAAMSAIGIACFVAHVSWILLLTERVRDRSRMAALLHPDADRLAAGLAQ